MSQRLVIEQFDYGDFSSLLGDEPAWRVASFPTRNGDFRLAEPHAVSIVQNGILRITVDPLTRSHDRVQFFDNAKHMLFSTRSFDVPAGGGISVELSIRSRVSRTPPGDLYAGFASFNLLDLSAGVALDWFCGHDRIAPVHARLPFPGARADATDPLTYYAIFEERAHDPGAMVRAGITYDRGSGEATWTLEDTVVWRARVPIACETFVAALGIMTEKDIGPSGATSLVGQGVTGEWSPLRIEIWR